MSTEHSEVDTGTEADKINTGALGTLIAVGLFAMLSITAAVTALVRHDIEIEQESKDVDANQVVTSLKAAQHDKLNGPASYVDRGRGVVSLPIDLAKGLVVGELTRDPNSATPPEPIKADAGVEVTGASVDSGAAGGTLAAGGAAGSVPDASKAGAASTAPIKPEPGRETAKPTPATSAKPTPVPTPTPTAATPGAASPGPTNK